VTPRRPLLELYRIRWDVADIAVTVSRFRRPHPGREDDEKSWGGLRDLVARWAGDMENPAHEEPGGVWEPL
jgi:hypothetical protein